MLSRALPGCEACSTLSKPRSGGRTCTQAKPCTVGVNTTDTPRLSSPTSVSHAHSPTHAWGELPSPRLHMQPARVLCIRRSMCAHERRRRQHHPHVGLSPGVGDQADRRRLSHLLQQRRLGQGQVCVGLWEDG
jgi:hypothetical protein